MGNLSNEEIKIYFDLNYHRLFLFAKSLVNDTEIAHDLVQDSFIVLIRANMKTSDAPPVIKSFLYTTVRNLASKNIRKQKSAQLFFRKEKTEEWEDAAVFEKLFQAEVIAELYLALESLPPGCKQICKLGYLEGLKNQEIADMLGVSINTVKTQKKRALQLLRDKISPQAFALLCIYLCH
ncbi:hypothetical protein BWD42_02645 [Sphingobacterium sp. CZ-UAM]|uniref:RNA polymerase sigma factor n=1 Tax=Sphingobacterium sp. CZ-UAM TaxID=1933868 RepID=UPI0009842DFE|nr:sigma-70 family RNA polymerase sigma factor [Sphingobacterium sp. CZ-UAM]OOG18877.1 hypothetical protein BWD42_02645 [Sphingobacterium sp. CZ-UAM]